MANQNQITINILIQNYNPYGKQEGEREREGKLERKRMSSTILINEISN